MNCCVCKSDIPQERLKCYRKSKLKALTCQDECYQQARLELREIMRPKDRVYVPKREWLRFLAWKAERSKPRQGSQESQEGILRTAQTATGERVG